jgi:hypothetical protein
MHRSAASSSSGDSSISSLGHDSLGGRARRRRPVDPTRRVATEPNVPVAQQQADAPSPATAPSFFRPPVVDPSFVTPTGRAGRRGSRKEEGKASPQPKRRLPGSTVPPAPPLVPGGPSSSTLLSSQASETTPRVRNPGVTARLTPAQRRGLAQVLQLPNVPWLVPVPDEPLPPAATTPPPPLPPATTMHVTGRGLLRATPPLLPPSRREVDFYRNPTVLSRLILHQKYFAAIRRLGRAPQEASIWVASKRPRRETSSSAAAGGSGSAASKAGSSTSSSSSSSPYSYRQLPLHTACENMGRLAPTDTINIDALNTLIQNLVVAYPDACRYVDHRRFSSLLSDQAEERGETIQSYTMGLLPLHEVLLYSYGPPPMLLPGETFSPLVQAETVSVVLMAYPDALQQNDPYGRLPMTIWEFNQRLLGDHEPPATLHPESKKIRDILAKGVEFWQRAHSEARFRLKRGTTANTPPLRPHLIPEEGEVDRTISRRARASTMGSTSVFASSEISVESMSSGGAESGRTPMSRARSTSSILSSCTEVASLAWSQLEQRALLLEQILNEMNEKNFSLQQSIEQLQSQKEQFQADLASRRRTGAAAAGSGVVDESEAEMDQAERYIAEIARLRGEKSNLEEKLTRMEGLVRDSPRSPPTTRRPSLPGKKRRRSSSSGGSAHSSLGDSVLLQMLAEERERLTRGAAADAGATDVAGVKEQKLLRRHIKLFQEYEALSSSYQVERERVLRLESVLASLATGAAAGTPTREPAPSGASAVSSITEFYENFTTTSSELVVANDTTISMLTNGPSELTSSQSLDASTQNAASDPSPRDRLVEIEWVPPPAPAIVRNLFEEDQVEAEGAGDRQPIQFDDSLSLILRAAAALEPGVIEPGVMSNISSLNSGSRGRRSASTAVRQERATLRRQDSAPARIQQDIEIPALVRHPDAEYEPVGGVGSERAGFDDLMDESKREIDEFSAGEETMLIVEGGRFGDDDEEFDELPEFDLHHVRTDTTSPSGDSVLSRFTTDSTRIRDRPGRPAAPRFPADSPTADETTVDETMYMIDVEGEEDSDDDSYDEDDDSEDSAFSSGSRPYSV